MTEADGLSGRRIYPTVPLFSSVETVHETVVKGPDRQAQPQLARPRQTLKPCASLFSLLQNTVVVPAPPSPPPQQCSDG